MSNPKELEIDYESLRDYYEHEAIIDIEDKYLDNDKREEDQENVEMREQQ
jgi:hypothetical protein